MDLLCPNDVLEAGLGYLKIDVKANWTSKQKNEEFHAHYGSSPLALATQWFDLIHADLPNFREKEKVRGFRMFMTAHHFLWAYPRNAQNLGNFFLDGQRRPYLDVDRTHCCAEGQPSQASGAS